MADHRKTGNESSHRSDAVAMPSDLDFASFSIETTTMRLKSLKLKRQASDVAAIDIDVEKKVPAPVKSVWDKPSETKPEPRPAGRVRHDDRGMAVWDFAVASGEFATLSATNMMKKLDVADLSIDETQGGLKAIQPKGRDAAGGGDPYNQRGNGKRPGEAGQRQGITGSPDRKSDHVLDQLTGKK
jgi:hypothetical protein